MKRASLDRFAASLGESGSQASSTAGVWALRWQQDWEGEGCADIFCDPVTSHMVPTSSPLASLGPLALNVVLFV